MKEEYVNFENANLLKEKHFYGDCHKCYYQYKEDENRIVLEDIQGDSREVYAPTLQVAMGWIKEEYKIYIAILPNRNENSYFFELYSKDDFYGGWEPVGDDDTSLEWSGETPLSMNYNSFEDAANAAIKYTLNRFANS